MQSEKEVPTEPDREGIDISRAWDLTLRSLTGLAAATVLVTALGFPVAVMQFERLHLPIQLLPRELAFRAGILPALMLIALFFTVYAQVNWLPLSDEFEPQGRISFADVWARTALYLCGIVGLGTFTTAVEGDRTFGPTALIVRFGSAGVIVLLAWSVSKLFSWTRLSPIRRWSEAKHRPIFFIGWVILAGFLLGITTALSGPFFLHPPLLITPAVVLRRGLSVSLLWLILLGFIELWDQSLAAARKKGPDATVGKVGLTVLSIIGYALVVQSYGELAYPRIPYQYGGGHASRTALWLQEGTSFPDVVRCDSNSHIKQGLSRCSAYIVYADADIVVLASSDDKEATGVIVTRGAVVAVDSR